MEAMSLETLLEAAKYVEYQTEAKARGEEPHDYHTFSKLCSASKDGQYPPPVVQRTPKKHSPVTHPPFQLPQEEAKEKRRPGPLILREHGLGHEHSGTGTREVHNKLEKNRRAHLKECFEALKKQLPHMDDRKTSNLSILRGAIRFIQVLKRKERDYEHDMERLAREKIAFQQRLSTLKKDLSSQLDHIDVNSFIPDDDNETTTTASECGALSDFDDNGPNDASTMNSAGTSDFASSSSSSTTSSVLVGPPSTASAVPPALSKASVSGAQMQTVTFKPEPVDSVQQIGNDSRLLLDNKPSVLSIPSSLAAQMSHAEGGSAQPTRVFTNNLHTMAGLFASPMQVISQPSGGIKVITNSHLHHPHGQIHVLTTPSSSSASSYISSAKPFSADSLVQVASGSAKGISRPHLVSPIALMSSQAMVELNHAKSSGHLTDLIGANSLNLSQKGGSVLAGNMAIVKGVSTANPSNMIATLHVSKPSHSQMIQSSLGPGIITQGGSHLNNGTHSGITTTMKPIVTSTVRTLPHITGIAHVVSQQSPVGQLVSPNPLVGAVSVVSHTGTVHPQSLGSKILATPVLKSVNPIPILQQQFLQQVSVGSSNQPIVKPVVVVSMPNVVPNANMSTLTPLVSLSEQGVARSAQK